MKREINLNEYSSKVRILTRADFHIGEDGALSDVAMPAVRISDDLFAVPGEHVEVALNNRGLYDYVFDRDYDLFFSRSAGEIEVVKP